MYFPNEDMPCICFTEDSGKNMQYFLTYRDISDF